MKKPGIEEMVKQAWETECEGSPMFQVASKIKLCRLSLLNWNRQQKSNTAVRIKEIQETMEYLKEQGGNRNWETWHDLRSQLDADYREKEAYWSQKSQVQWLQDGNKNT